MIFWYLTKIHTLILLLSQSEYYIIWKVLNTIDLCSLENVVSTDHFPGWVTGVFQTTNGAVVFTMQWLGMLTPGFETHISMTSSQPIPTQAEALCYKSFEVAITVNQRFRVYFLFLFWHSRIFINKLCILVSTTKNVINH